MAEVQSNVAKKHIVRVVYGEAVEISGVVNVLSYNDKEILLKTSDNQLLIRGSGFNIEVLNLEQGEVKAVGKFTEMSYVKDAAKPSFMKRIFK